MIGTKTFLQSAYFEEVRNSLAFLKVLEPVTKVLKLPMGSCRCIPTTKTVSKKLDIPIGAVEQEVERLLQLRWARKYKKEKKALFVIGSNERLFMTNEIHKLFRKADRRVDGIVKATEWRWIPSIKWTGTTLWAMIQDKLRERGQDSVYAKAKGRAQLSQIITSEGIKTAKAVGIFFAEHYDALRIYFNWYGLPNAGLFRGFFHSIKDIKERGFPAKKGGVHNRGEQESMAKTVIDEEWKEL